MKKLITILLLIILIATLLPGAPVLAGLPFSPHEDPETATDTFGAISLLNYYGEIMGLISEGNFADVDNLLAQLDGANIPDDLRDIINLYNSLTSDVSAKLDSIDTLLDEAASLLSQNRLSEAQDKLDEVGTEITEAENLLAELTTATRTLGEKVGVFASAASGLLKKAYDNMDGMVQKVHDLKDRYESLQEQLDEQVREKEADLTPTQLSLNVPAEEIFVGNEVTLSGMLKDKDSEDNSPLGSRVIALYIVDSLQGTVTTDEEGKYSKSLTVPYKYVSTMEVRAVYTPADSDKDIYQGTSATETIQIGFYDTYLELTVPEEAHPGFPMSVNGRITSDGSSLNGRIVEVFLDDGSLPQASGKTGEDGQFTLILTPPSDTSVGDHTLNVSVASWQRYAGVSEEITLTITKMVTQVEVRSPYIVFSSSDITITGCVLSGGAPVPGAVVTLTLRGESVETITGEDGEFRAVLHIPLDPTYMGNQAVEVTVIPAEPWYDQTQTEVKTFVANIINIGFLFVALVCIGVVLYTRRRGQVDISLPGQIVTVAPPVEQVAKDEASKATPHRPHGGGAVGAYYDAVEIVEAVSSVAFEPHMTMREFLKDCRTGLGDVEEDFTILTAIAEKALYSAVAPGDEEITRAENLSQQVQRGLKSGLA